MRQGAVARKLREHRLARTGQFVGGMEHLRSRGGQQRATAAGATDGALHQRRPGQVAQGVQRLPGRLVAHAGIARGLRDRAQRRNAPQDFQALVRRLVAEGAGELQRGTGHAPILALFLR